MARSLREKLQEAAKARLAGNAAKTVETLDNLEKTAAVTRTVPHPDNQVAPSLTSTGFAASVKDASGREEGGEPPGADNLVAFPHDDREDFPRDVSQDHVEAFADTHVQAIVEDTPGNSKEGYPRAYPKDFLKDDHEDDLKDTADSVGVAGQGEIQDRQGQEKKFAADAPSDTVPGGRTGPASGSPQAALQAHLEVYPQDFPQDLNQDLRQDIPKDIPKDIPAALSDDVAQAKVQAEVQDQRIAKDLDQVQNFSESHPGALPGASPVPSPVTSPKPSLAPSPEAVPEIMPTKKITAAPIPGAVPTTKSAVAAIPNPGVVPTLWETLTPAQKIVLAYLVRHQGEIVRHAAIATEAALPVGTVQTVCKRLRALGVMTSAYGSRGVIRGMRFSLAAAALVGGGLRKRSPSGFFGLGEKDQAQATVVLSPKTTTSTQAVASLQTTPQAYQKTFAKTFPLTNPQDVVEAERLLARSPGQSWEGPAETLCSKEQREESPSKVAHPVADLVADPQTFPCDRPLTSPEAHPLDDAETSPVPYQEDSPVAFPHAVSEARRKNNSVAAWDIPSTNREKNSPLSKKRLQIAWPRLTQKGFGPAHLRFIRDTLRALGKPTDRLVTGLDHIEFELAHGHLPTDRDGRPVTDVCAWVVGILARSGYYPRPAQYVSPEEQALADEAAEMRAMAAARQRLEQTRFTVWCEGLSEAKRQRIVAAAPDDEAEAALRAYFEKHGPRQR